MNLISMVASEKPFKPTLAQLTREIVAVNHAWKEAKELLGDTCPLTGSLRQIKNRLQVRLLQNYPSQTFLILDTDVESEEPLYSVQLVTAIDGRTNAEHIPVRVVQQSLTSEELLRFIKQ